MIFKDKTVVITGGSEGVGKATARLFANAGANLVLAARSKKNLEAVAEELRELTNVQIFAMDVRDDAAVQDGVARAQPDVLFNCAGFVHHGSILAATDADWDFAFDLNVRSMFRTMRAALPGMRERGAGSIINMSSALSSIIGAPNRFIYGTTKAAVIGMTKSVAVEYIKEGIRCNCICPGTVESPSWHDRVKALGEEMGSYDAAMEAFVARQPMGRVATAEEIAALVVYLASDESAFTTGQPFVIDGGWSG